MYIGELRPAPPYDLNTTGQLLGQYHGVLDVYREGFYRRALYVDGDILLVQVKQHGPPDAPTLMVEQLAGKVVPDDRLLTAARHILAVEVDVAPFFNAAQAHPRLWRVLEPLYGVRHFHSETVFEALMTVIIEQQISLYAALRAQRAIAEWGGVQIEHEDVLYYAFPLPDAIATANAADLQRTLKITHRRVAVMQRIARQITDGDLNLERLRTLPEAEAYHQLMALNGIGHWTAAWTLLRGMGHYQRIAHNDVALRSAVAHHFHDSDDRISADAVVETLNAFAPHAGRVAFYTLMRWAMDRY